MILGELGHAGLEWRSLGQTDYPTTCPLREVVTLARHCCGGVILGFSQFQTKTGSWKAGTPFAKIQRETIAFPTPWNHLEAGILYSLGLPLLVFRESAICGGIFDNGVADLFIHQLPSKKITKRGQHQLRQIIRKFSAEAHARYYAR
jgi:hypothetical protein